MRMFKWFKTDNEKITAGVEFNNKIVNLADYKASKERDDLYEAVLDFAESQGGISISTIQKQFTIGYARAKKIMGDMERDGYVGPPTFEG